MSNYRWISRDARGSLLLWERKPMLCSGGVWKHPAGQLSPRRYFSFERVTEDVAALICGRRNIPKPNEVKKL